MSKKMNSNWLILLVVILVLLFAGFFLLKPTSIPQENDSKAEAQLYDALANAAKAPKLHISMYREGFANKADADSRSNAGDIASSISELDTTNGNYRSVWANNYLHYPEFSVGRCVDADSYIEDYRFVNKAPRATSLKNVTTHLKPLPTGHLAKTNEHLPHDPCPWLGIIPGGTSDLATARLSDGVFPVTLSAEETNTWKTNLQAAHLFNVRDEGTVQKDGKELHKFSFMPKDASSVNKKLYNLFYEAAEIDKVKAEHPDAQWQHGFISINYANSGSVGGYYLIDDVTKFPIYSELYSTNIDKKTGEGALARKNIYHTKQSYSFPTQLTITADTPLEFLE